MSFQALLGVLGEHLCLGRKRRKESLRVWALRMNVSIPTLPAVEKGDPRSALGGICQGALAVYAKSLRPLWAKCLCSKTRANDDKGDECSLPNCVRPKQVDISASIW